MSTRALLENLADAVEGIAGDYKSRINRIEAKRQRLAVKQNEVLKPIAQMRRALDEFEQAVREEFEAMARLEDAELSETAGEDEEAQASRGNGAFKEIGDGSKH